MRTAVTIYAKKDLDLMALYYRLGKQDFLYFLKDSLRTLVRRDYEPRINLSHRLSNGLLLSVDEPKNIKLNVSITSEKDKDIEKLLSCIKERKVGIFVKQAMRLYMGTVCLQAYFTGEIEDALKTMATPVQTQVFNLSGNVSVPSPRARVVYRDTTKKPTAKKQNTAKEAEKEITVAGVSDFSKAVSFSEPEKYEEEIRPTGSNEDDVLAMLSALLG